MFDSLLLLVTAVTGQIFLIPLVLGFLGILTLPAIVVLHLLMAAAAFL